MATLLNVMTWTLITAYPTDGFSGPGDVLVSSRQLERRPKTFVWHKTADEILDSLAAYCQRINDSGH
jgi:hypothetical protein